VFFVLVMDVKDFLARVEGSLVFKEWKQSHESNFLAHVFVMLDGLKRESLVSGDCQVGFFDSVKGFMATFFVDGGNVRVVVDQEILKSDLGIFELDVGKISVSVDSVLDCACSVLCKDYANAGVLRTFFIVQQLRGVPVFNITFFTLNFKTVNVKVSAVDGSVVHHSSASVAEFG